MQPLSAGTLLELWKRSHQENPVERALSLLHAGCPEVPRNELAELPVGARDQRLLRLREMMFGPRLNCVAACPACGESVEVELACQELWLGTEAQPEHRRLALSGVEVEWRLPNSADLLAALQAPDVDRAREIVCRRCIAGPLEELACETVQTAIEEMERADPRAKIELAMQCPACGFGFVQVFDIVAYFWREIDARARRIFREIHTLARAYGWSERDILGLSAWRRQLYVEMAGA
jgi:hypothetical protein